MFYITWGVYSRALLFIEKETYDIFKIYCYNNLKIVSWESFFMLD